MTCREDPEVRHAIEAVIDRFVRGLESGDVDAMMQAYSPDLVYMPEAIATDHGREGTRKGFEAMIRRYEARLDVRIDEVMACPGFAYDIGKVTLTLTPRAPGKKMVRTRRFLEIWRLESGKWKVLRAMSNIDAGSQ